MTAPLPNVWFNESAQPSLGPASPVTDTEFPSVSVATSYELETFSEHARRRCMDKISPPLPKPERNVDEVVNFDALYQAITHSHPRDLDLDPPPLFLRSPRPAFLQALFDLGGAR